MSKFSVTEIDISRWIQKARANPSQYRERQLTRILLTAISITPGFGDGLFLKGGILMALAYDSPRTTGDIDFSSTGDPVKVKELVSEALDAALKEAAIRSGYPDIVCKVQRISLRPRPETFAESEFPALEITIGSANRNSISEMARFNNNRSAQVLRIDLSFREPIGSIQRILIGGGRTIQAYGIFDVIAEKLRAILQQITRPHGGDRRQDVYDICHLLKTFHIDGEEKSHIYSILVMKSRERGFMPYKNMISNSVIIQRLRSSWPKLAAELQEPLPDFDEYFIVVRNFYESLPWEIIDKPELPSGAET